MAKVTALHGGGDWADASAEYLILPVGMDINAEYRAREDWYYSVYVPESQAGKKPRYVSLFDWLKERGAREPSSDELEVFSDT